MFLKYIVLLILALACTPSAEVGKGRMGSDGSGSGTPPNVDIPQYPTQWNYLSSVTSNINLHVSNLNNAYIIGSKVEEFLNLNTNFSENYCLISRYAISGSTHELRTRITPISYYDFSAKRTVKVFRVDFNDAVTSDSICYTGGIGPGPLPLFVLDSNSNLVPSSVPIALSTFNPGSLCTNCTNSLPTTKLMIFKRAAGQLHELKLSDIDLTPLKLNLDPNTSSSGGSGTCSQSSCAARGFDCCLDNQCVMDGAIRSSAQTLYPQDYATALEEMLTNSQAYLNYPHIYYVCPGHVPTDPGSTTGGNNGGGYTQGLTQLMQDYFCIDHMKKHKTGETFHEDISLGSPFFPDLVDIPDVQTNPATLYPQNIVCRTVETDGGVTQSMFYKKVVERLYQNCGCAQTSLEGMLNLCPKFDYQIDFLLSNGLPNSVSCYTPSPNNPPIPQQQTVSVNSKSAPHRYFRKCGKENIESTACANAELNEQEGERFFYQDDERLVPYQKSFDMNSILGQMTVALDQALPAKVVNVQLDQVYQLATVSGYYTPCPSCDKDKWYAAFSSNPMTGYGGGLQNVGFSTNRMAFDGNTTNGNYEDTIFGRACWLPPTMLPFTHRPIGSTATPATNSQAQAQRVQRLQTQAALYANGYQKDWYGFNKGALIGSFDGVTWFAIGKGRIVKATSNKLYLAINAPFADLASPTLHTVNVIAYDGLSNFSTVDYDPSLHLSHASQNSAGTCQANHSCSVDKDCVSKLGWEYMCADVRDITTKWPTFDTNGVEIAGVANPAIPLYQILQQKSLPSSDSKRCVYRGAGSPCVQDPRGIADLNKRKTLTCAPNFYCAPINSSSNFNTRVSRYASKLEEISLIRNHYFGKDANVLGRPLNYVPETNSGSLYLDIQNSIRDNLDGYIPGALVNNIGLCQPGKALPEVSNQSTLSNPYEQHKTNDPSFRTDYINQISSCNSGLFSSMRYSSCPVINAEGNYEFLTSSFATLNYEKRAMVQNSCGLDSLSSAVSLSSSLETLSQNSPFQAIEGKPLKTTTIIDRMITRDACLRRAGQVCHTNLDCGPNELMANQVDNVADILFGNLAEKSYYAEYLICGQGKPKPLPTETTAYRNYKMSENLCCREVGKDITTYTSDIPKVVNPVVATMSNGTIMDDEYETASYSLKMSMAPGMAPNDPKRYSRLAVVDGVGTLPTRPILSAFQSRIGSNYLDASMTGANITTPHQWKTLREANTETCCGGGWVRKFADGTNDWSNTGRVYLDVKNFACINSRHTLLTNPSEVDEYYLTSSSPNAQSWVNRDYNNYCQSADGSLGNCAQYTITDSISDTPHPVPGSSGYIIIDNTILLDQYLMSGNTRADFFFDPKSLDVNPLTYMVNNTEIGSRKNIKVQLPSFLDISTASSVRIFDDTSGGHVNACLPLGSSTSIASLSPDAASASCPGVCCSYLDSTERKLYITLGTAFAGTTLNIPDVKINAALYGTKVVGATSPFVPRQTPGTSSYYLRRLGRLELSGIPQIAFNPLYCSDNSDRVVPGIFKSLTPDLNRADFEAPNYSFRESPTSEFFTNKHSLKTDDVFAANEFKCCSPLGTSTKDKNKCCSGFGVADASGTSFTCALPNRTNLTTYFNRFVSNEGQGENQPGGGLIDTDFDDKTGEPLLTSTVVSKIRQLGTTYCASKKVRLGGAFGEFKLEPVPNGPTAIQKIYGIVDSANDFGTLSVFGGTVDVGHDAFYRGFRWNHHLYCDDAGN